MTPQERKAIRRVLGNRLRALRRDAQLDQRALAQRLDRSPAWLSLIERGIREPSLTETIDIARILGKDPMQLFASITSALPRSSHETSTP